METEALRGPGLICHQPAVGVRPAVGSSAHSGVWRGGVERGRAEGEPEHKSRVVLRGLIMRARGPGFLDAVLVLEQPAAPGRCCK